MPILAWIKVHPVGTDEDQTEETPLYEEAIIIVMENKCNATILLIPKVNTV
jgi:hypothetical protein